MISNIIYLYFLRPERPADWGRAPPTQARHNSSSAY